ncbi:MAG: mandelate racemase/muconate lactonizing enzyme family protein [Acidilobus sp.]|uniref:mandelate racemase/muconate lactonizing enzyme family protein n=1 Tax=Acidilobus sp. 7A TaxID=1577685 RepID=UPI000764E103|nr:mandelate racemase/muconate lactonizing enzyme family protein [Acidilobus sp. 7A]AMD30800.1 mandelate racemase [Acidilobus sp. 7A]
MRELRITKVSSFTVQANFQWTFVRVYAGDLYGTGEAGPTPGASAIAEALGKVIVGEDALKVNRVLQKLRWATLYAGTSAYHIISAIDMALYDLIGKYLNVPVYALLGGDRTEVPVYVDAHGGKGLEAMDSTLMPVEPSWAAQANVERERIKEPTPVHGRLTAEQWNPDYSPEGYASRAKELKAEGWRAIKFDLDVPTPYSDPLRLRSGRLSQAEVQYLASLASAVREAVGYDVDIMFDLHWRYDVSTGVALCRALEPVRPRWVEDPTPAVTTLTNFDELRLITSQCPVPIEVGENLYTSYQFKDLIGTGIMVWAPDPAKAGGITELRRIEELASLYDIEVSPHNIGSPIATVAAAHAASVGNTFGALEFHGHDLPFWNDLVKSKKRVIDVGRGAIVLGDEPGLGVELDEEVARRLWPGFEL